MLTPPAGFFIPVLKRYYEKRKRNKYSFFEHLAAQATKAPGSTAAILIAFGAVMIWALLGPVFIIQMTGNWRLTQVQPYYVFNGVPYLESSK